MRMRFKRDPQRSIFLPEQAVPPADPNPDWKGPREVLMLRTVVRSNKWEYLANRRYNLIAEVADEFILKGYATGDLSRAFSEDERLETLAGVQTISLGRS